MAIETPSNRTNRLSAYLLPALCAGLISCAQQQVAPSTQQPTPSLITPIQVADAELARFAPAGMAARIGARIDIDDDGDEDALIITEHDSDHAGSDPRGLLLLRRDADGSLREALNNSNAILCRKCGGMMGDPLQGIRIEHDEFTLRFEGGSRELWSSEYRFEYERDRGLWLLASIVHCGFDRTNGRVSEQRLTASDFGDVSLADFDPEDYPADALP